MTPYANARQLVAWTLGLGANARVIGPPELVAELRERVGLLVERHSGDPQIADVLPGDSTAAHANGNGALPPASSRADEDDAGRAARVDTAIRPERFARLVTLASMLIDAGRAGRLLDVDELCAALNVSDQELGEDISLLNVVNFGAGTYVLYAEINDDGTIEVDPEPYGDSFARPARLLPVEAKALVAAIDFVGEHIPEGSLSSVRAKVVDALGEDPAQEGLQFSHPGGGDTEIALTVSRACPINGCSAGVLQGERGHVLAANGRALRADQRTRGLVPGGVRPGQGGVRHFRLDRIKSARSPTSFTPRPDVNVAADVNGWPKTGEVPASNRARVWISPERARWAREERNVVAELADGAVIVELGFAGVDWLVRETLKEAGDAVVLEPPEAREAVRDAAAEIAEGALVGG